MNGPVKWPGPWQAQYLPANGGIFVGYGATEDAARRAAVHMAIEDRTGVVLP